LSRWLGDALNQRVNTGVIIMMNDKQLQQSVTEELAWDPSIMSAHIGVTAREGVVTLSGHVPSYWEKRSAEAAASRVKGVKAVVEEIKVQLANVTLWTDDQLAERALQNLASDGSVPKDQIKLAIEKGWVTLTGEVDWNYQKIAAEYDIHRLLGVVGVTNEIRIKPRVQAYEVREKIEKALERIAPFDAADISIKRMVAKSHSVATFETGTNAISSRPRHGRCPALRRCRTKSHSAGDLRRAAGGRLYAGEPAARRNGKLQTRRSDQKPRSGTWD
jgi:osmotically-inducible protein OsmY